LRPPYENFVPWHIDNLLLEILIEWGLLGLGALTAVAVWTLILAAQGIGRHMPLALFVMGSISATFLIGGVVSVIEFPRVSTMLWLLLVVSPLVREDIPLEQKVLDGEDGLSVHEK
jgi:O-antigen ligase